jgi:signal transduction histidine kinase
MGVITQKYRLLAAALIAVVAAALDLLTGATMIIPLYAASGWIAGLPQGRALRHLPLLGLILLCVTLGVAADILGRDPCWALRATSLGVAALPHLRFGLRVHSQIGERASLAGVYRTRFEYAPIPMTEEDWSGAARRIAELRRAGVTDLRAHLDSHPGLVAELAGLAVICDVNPAAVRVYRAPDRETLIAHFNDTDGYDGASAYADIFKTVLCALDAGEHVVTVEGPDRTFTGETIELRSSTSVVPDTSEPWSVVMQTVEDITEAKLIENRLRDARDEAQWANSTKSEFLSAMSHEMRTPLNAIIGFGQIMADEMMGPLGNDRYREYAGDINDSGRHLLRLINDLLDVSRIEAGKLTLQLESIQFEQILRASLRLITAPARSAGIELETHVPPDLPRIEGDERRLRQIVINLLSNALKFTPRGGKITVSLAKKHEGIGFTVRDSGVGISPDDLARVTRPFEQSARYLSQHQEGSGLGLAVTNALVEQHGGTMTIESRLDHGTTVFVWLPCHSPVKKMAQT